MGRLIARFVVLGACVALALAFAGCAGAPGGEAGSNPTTSSGGTAQGSGGSGGSSAGTSGGSDVVDVGGGSTDEMWSKDVSGAEFYVLQIDGAPLTVDHVYPVDVYSETGLEDGRFYKVVADVTLLNGGVAGYVDFPEVKSVTSCTEVSPFDIGLPSVRDTPYGVVLIGDYADGDILLNENGIMAVWKDGGWSYRYDKSIKLSDGTRALVRSGIEEADVQAGIGNGTLSCKDYFVLP